MKRVDQKSFLYNNAYKNWSLQNCYWVGLSVVFRVILQSSVCVRLIPLQTTPRNRTINFIGLNISLNTTFKINKYLQNGYYYDNDLTKKSLTIIFPFNCDFSTNVHFYLTPDQLQMVSNYLNRRC